MSIRAHVRKLRPIKESYISPEEKLQYFFAEQAQLPSEVFDGFTHEINTKKSTTKRTVITVRSSDRDNDRDERERGTEIDRYIHN